MIVRFDNRRSRDFIYSARRELRNSHPVPTPIYINEQRKVISYFWNAEKCGKVEKISSAWTWNGNVFIKPPIIEGGATVKVHCLEDLNSV